MRTRQGTRASPFAGQTIMITLGLPVACEAPMFCRVCGRLDSYSVASKRRAGSGQWRRKTWMAPRSVRTTWELLAGWAVRHYRPRRRRSQPILHRSNSSRSTRPASISSPTATSSWPWSGGDCEPGTGDGSGALNTDAVAALSHLARVINKRGVDVAKVMASGGITTPGTDVMRTQFSADKMHLLVELAHDPGLPITAHAHSLAAVEQAVDAGADSIEHCSCLTEKGSVLSEELVARMPIETSPLAVCSTPIQMDLSHAPPAIRQLIAATGWTPQRMRERRVDMLNRLHVGGARIVTGIDAGIGP